MNIKLEMINKLDYEQMIKLISEVWDFSDYFPKQIEHFKINSLSKESPQPR